MVSNEDKIKHAFKERTWNEIQSEDSWRIFKIVSEFVEGFETLSQIGPGVAIFGSARTDPGTRYYEAARTTSRLLSESGLVIITGGGPGI